jgi:N-acetylneuraminate synthase
MVYVIAEIGINHNGNFDLAKELMLKSKEAGCDAVKFQKRTIDLVYTKDELDRFRESPWGTTNREQKEGLEFSLEQYKELESYASELGLDFIVSCWDLNSVDEIEKACNVKYHKVASALATDKKFLERLNKTGKPVILSTGMCSEEQIEAAVGLLNNVEYVLACTSTYPTKAEQVNLKHIQTLKSKYSDKEIGFSNHYNGLDACVGAVALGAQCVEFHVTKDRAMYGSDQSASIQNVTYMVEAIRNMEKMIGDGIKRVYESELPIAKKLRKVEDTLDQ